MMELPSERRKRRNRRTWRKIHHLPLGDYAEYPVRVIHAVRMAEDAAHGQLILRGYVPIEADVMDPKEALVETIEDGDCPF